MKKQQELAETFYNAVWDLAEGIAALPRIVRTGRPYTSPSSLTGRFEVAALPFLDLRGRDLPQHMHREFDQVDAIVRDEIFPALKVLGQEWNVLRTKVEANKFDAADEMDFAKKCAYLSNKIMLEVIPGASELEKRMLLPG